MNLPTIENSVLILVDVQERLMRAMDQVDAVLNRIELLLKGCAALHVDVIVTEQYPQGLGATLPELTALLPAGTPVLPKTEFSVFGNDDFRSVLSAKRREWLFFCGIESPVCVQQSVFDALNAGFQVAVAGDAVTSRKASDPALALSTFRHAGAQVWSVESILFQWLRTAKHPEFRTISRLVR